MNAPPEQVTITPTECGDCGGSLAQAFPTTRNYLRCRRCGHVTLAPVTMRPIATERTYIDPR